ncbi:MAG TPA: hypothetical protein P5277_04380 [Candidatus Paceibacterota bacterium]|nr:hypothetical protein [Candidatus Paceibacterota bacterium]
MEQMNITQTKVDDKSWGSLWLVKEKKTVKSPDLSGEAKIGNQRFKLAVWKNFDRSNNKPDYKICLSKFEPSQKEAELN